MLTFPKANKNIIMSSPVNEVSTIGDGGKVAT